MRWFYRQRAVITSLKFCNNTHNIVPRVTGSERDTGVPHFQFTVDQRPDDRLPPTIRKFADQPDKRHSQCERADGRRRERIQRYDGLVRHPGRQVPNRQPADSQSEPSDTATNFPRREPQRLWQRPLTSTPRTSPVTLRSPPAVSRACSWPNVPRSCCPSPATGTVDSSGVAVVRYLSRADGFLC
jgi:hypothetical protein